MFSYFIWKKGCKVDEEVKALIGELIIEAMENDISTDHLFPSDHVKSLFDSVKDKLRKMQRFVESLLKLKAANAEEKKATLEMLYEESSKLMGDADKSISTLSDTLNEVLPLFYTTDTYVQGLQRVAAQLVSLRQELANKVEQFWNNVD